MVYKRFWWCFKKYAVLKLWQSGITVYFCFVKITITFHCPNCQSTKVKKNGQKSYGKQNYQCKFCGRQFIGNYALTDKGSLSSITQCIILLMLVRVIGIRDIALIKGIST